MKPGRWQNINITGREKSAAEVLRQNEVMVMRLHLQDYQRAGQPVPDAVIERARKLGIECGEVEA